MQKACFSAAVSWGDSPKHASSQGEFSVDPPKHTSQDLHPHQARVKLRVLYEETKIYLIGYFKWIHYISIKLCKKEEREKWKKKQKQKQINTCTSNRLEWKRQIPEHCWGSGKSRAHTLLGGVESGIITLENRCLSPKLSIKNQLYILSEQNMVFKSSSARFGDHSSEGKRDYKEM